MPLDPAIQQYLHGYNYRFDHGPDLIRTRLDALRYGLNCGALVHLLLDDLFGYRIPAELMCIEMFYDTAHFQPVDGEEGLRQGDVAFFGARDVPLDEAKERARLVNGRLLDWRQHPTLHLALCVDDALLQDACFIHATAIRDLNGVYVWPLARFLDTKQYGILHGVRRLQVRGP